MGWVAETKRALAACRGVDEAAEAARCARILLLLLLWVCVCVRALIASDQNFGPRSVCVCVWDGWPLTKGATVPAGLAGHSVARWV